MVQVQIQLCFILLLLLLIGGILYRSNYFKYNNGHRYTRKRASKKNNHLGTFNN